MHPDRNRHKLQILDETVLRSWFGPMGLAINPPKLGGELWDQVFRYLYAIERPDPKTPLWMLKDAIK